MSTLTRSQESSIWHSFCWLWKARLCPGFDGSHTRTLRDPEPYHHWCDCSSAVRQVRSLFSLAGLLLHLLSSMQGEGSGQHIDYIPCQLSHRLSELPTPNAEAARLGRVTQAAVLPRRETLGQRAGFKRCLYRACLVCRMGTLGQKIKLARL